MNKWERRDEKREKARKHVRHADFQPQLKAIRKRVETRRIREWAEAREAKVALA